MATTTEIRGWWGAPCAGAKTKVGLYGDGTVYVRDEIVDATHALSRCFEHYSYETRAADTGAYNCRRITGGTGYSLHAYGVAIDCNWTTNPYGPVLHTDMPPAMIAAIKAIRTVTGRQVWRWGGDYAGNKDAMHFEVVASPADLATGIDPKTLPGASAPSKPAPITLKEGDMLLLQRKSKPTNCLLLIPNPAKPGGIEAIEVHGSESPNKLDEKSWTYLANRFGVTDTPD